MDVLDCRDIPPRFECLAGGEGKRESTAAAGGTHDVNRLMEASYRFVDLALPGIRERQVGGGDSGGFGLAGTAQRIGQKDGRPGCVVEMQVAGAGQPSAIGWGEQRCRLVASVDLSEVGVGFVECVL